MKAKEIIAIYLKSIFPVIIVFPLFSIYNYITGTDSLLEYVYWLPIVIFYYYISYLIIGLPLVAVLHGTDTLKKIYFIIIGLLSGFMVMAFLESFNLDIKGLWPLYLISTVSGGLSGYYVYCLLKKKV